jgi:AraC family transcriptional regulator
MDKIRILTCIPPENPVSKPSSVMTETLRPETIRRALSLSYLYGGVVHYRPGDRLRPRILPDFELVLIIEGQVIYRRDAMNHSTPPGTIILARPNFHESYIWDTKAPTRHAYLHFDITQMPEDWPSLTDWPVVHLQPDPVLSPMVRHLIGNVASHPEWLASSPGADGCRFLECLLRILLRPVQKSPLALAQNFPEPVHQALKLMRDVIDQEPHRTLHLADLARHSGITDKHLCRVFQTSLGHAPMQTFRLLKLQLAIALLNRSNLTKEIADRCGFENPLYFTRCFTQTYGASPRAVRQSLREHQPPPPNPLPPEITPRIFW